MINYWGYCKILYFPRDVFVGIRGNVDFISDEAFRVGGPDEEREKIKKLS
jgi:hypothetical protein